MIVLDANILVRAVLGRRVKFLLETYSARGVRFCAPQETFDDAGKYLPEILVKRGKTTEDLSGSLKYLAQIVEPLDPDFYCFFESEARIRLRGRDEEDWPVLAAALGLHCPI